MNFLLMNLLLLLSLKQVGSVYVMETLILEVLVKTKQRIILARMLAGYGYIARVNNEGRVSNSVETLTRLLEEATFLSRCHMVDGVSDVRICNHHHVQVSS